MKKSEEDRNFAKKGDSKMDNQQNQTDNILEQEIPAPTEENSADIRPTPAPATAVQSIAAKLLRPKALIALIAACIVIIVGAIAISANTDKSVINSALDNMVDRIGDEELFTALDKGMKQGRYSFTIGKDSELLQRYDYESGELVNIAEEIKLDIWMSSGKKGKGVARLTALDEDLSCYLSEEGVYFDTSLLSDAYGITFEKLSKQIEDSDLFDDIFEDDSFDLGDGATGVAGVNSFAFDTYVAICENIDKYSDDTEKILNKYVKFLKNELYKNAEKETVNESGNRVVTLTLDEEAISDTVKAFFEKAAKDKSLIEYLDTYFSLEELELNDYDNWKELLKDNDVCEDICDGIESVSFKIKIEVAASSMLHNMKSLKVTVSAEGAKVAFTVDMSEKDTISAKLTSSYSGNTQTLFKLKYTTSKEGFKLILDMDDASVSINFVEKEGGKYKMTVSTESSSLWSGTTKTEAVITGKYENNRKHFLFSIDKVTVDTETSYDDDDDDDDDDWGWGDSDDDEEESTEKTLDITFEIVYKDTMPDFPSKAKNILDLEDEDVDGILDELREWMDENSEDEDKGYIVQVLEALFQNIGSADSDFDY